MTYKTARSRRLHGASIGVMIGLLSITLLGGCADAGKVVGPVDTPPHALNAKLKGGPVAASVAIDDAITRLLPALAGGGSISALEAGLVQIQSQLDGPAGAGLNRALSEAVKALDKYQQTAGDEFLPDIVAMQLALLTVGKSK